MKIHLLNAISAYGIRKPSYVTTYLRTHTQSPIRDWKFQYKGMIREYIKYRREGQGIKEYFMSKRIELIDRTIEEKRREKKMIIERMLYGYDNLEDSSFDSPIILEREREGEDKEKVFFDEFTSWNITSDKRDIILDSEYKTSFNTNKEVFISSPREVDSYCYRDRATYNYLEVEEAECGAIARRIKSMNSLYLNSLTAEERDLECMMFLLEHKENNFTVSSVSPLSLEKFFRGCLDREKDVFCLPIFTPEPIAMEEPEEPEELEEEEGDEGENFAEEEIDDSCPLKEYYSLEFHEYPKKKSSRDRGKWVAEYRAVLRRLRAINGGVFSCSLHSDRKRKGRKVKCIKCFSADDVEGELEKAEKSSISEYVFRAMLFLQMALFSSTVDGREADMIKSELYKFYEYYRK